MRIILAYSGGLDTSVILKWLQERYRAQVTALIADVGQAEDLAAIGRRAEQTGADRVVIADLRDAFAREFVFPAVQANAVYEGAYLLGTALARPLIARALVEQAQHEKADAVAHGATGKGNDQVRFELGVAALAPDLKVIAPWREWDLTSRPALLDYARAHGIAVEAAGPSYSMDANLMHISYEGLGLEDPWQEPDPAMFRMTAAPEQAPDAAEYVEIDFADGVATAVNGDAFSPAALVMRLNDIGGRHGVGRVDVVENRFIGLKSRGVYETPGVTLLHLAHRAVESLTMDREVMHLRDELMPRFAEAVYNGFWFAPEMRALRVFIADTQHGVTGTARLKLYKGSAAVVGRKAPQSLYDREAVSFDTAGDFSGRDAEGFIKLQALRLRVQGKR